MASEVRRLAGTPLVALSRGYAVVMACCFVARRCRCRHVRPALVDGAALADHVCRWLDCPALVTATKVSFYFTSNVLYSYFIILTCRGAWGDFIVNLNPNNLPLWFFKLIFYLHVHELNSTVSLCSCYRWIHIRLRLIV